MKFQPPPLIERLHRAVFPQPPVQVPDYLYADPYTNPFAKPQLETPDDAETPAASEPPTIAPTPRDLGAEVSEILQPVSNYLAGFTIIDPPDDFDRGYKNPLDTSPPPQPFESSKVQEFEARKTELENSLRSWADLLRGFLEDHRAWATGELQAQHAEAWAKAREQTGTVEGILAEGSQSAEDTRRLKLALGNARSLWQSHKAAKPDMATLPSQGDIDAWESELRRLYQAYEAAQQAVDQQLERNRRLAWRYETENIKLVTLERTEADIRARLSGDDIREVGLMRPAEL
jgi:hypothetical protein